MVARVTRPELRPFVTGLYGYRERYAEPVSRVEVAMPAAILILGFAGPTEVDGAELASFTGGLSDRFTRTRTSVPTEGIEVFLTPFGARRLFGLPMRELTNLVVDVGDLPGGWGAKAVARLGEAAGDDERLTLTEDLLAERILGGADLGPELPWAWARLLRSGGALSAASLAEALGWSHRHLVARFHDEIGLAPKAAARVIRFQRALRLVREGVPIARVAAVCGFYDQAHMNRDFKLLGDVTPGQIFPRPLVSGGEDSAV